MDIESLATEYARESTIEQARVAVLSKSLDRQRTDAEGLARLMASAALPPLPEGAGSLVDVRA